MIRICVDSTSDFSPEEIRELNMLMVPLTINFGEESYLDNVDLDRDSFYERLIHGDVLPKTSLAAPGQWLEVFEAAQSAGDELICITVSSAVSGTYQSALNAKEMLGYDGIYVIDSRSTSAAMRVLADQARWLIKCGLSAPEIAEQLEQLRERIHVIAALDTLDYLQKGGRLSKAAAAIGSLASIKPVITLDERGGIAMAQKCLGRSKALQFLLSHMKKQDLDPNFPLYSLYTYGTDNCQKLEDSLSQNAFPAPIRQRVNGVIGTHVGPEVYGLVYVTK